MSHNLCYGKDASCSACCGINNIDLSQDEKKERLLENTRNFLEINLSDQALVLKFRSSGEDYLKKLMIRPDVYICPFIGFTGEMSNKTGCLLNRDGSPHDQVKVIEAPLHFSFYGENICKTYDCVGKQNILSIISQKESGDASPGELRRGIFDILTRNLQDWRNNGENHRALFGNLDPLTYGKFISNHNLVSTCQKIIEKHPGVENALIDQIVEKLEKTEIPVTSFEMSLTFEFFTDEQLWHVLGTLFYRQGYIFEAFEITDQGKLLGNEIKVKSGIC
jgi:hypothetical protein